MGEINNLEKLTKDISDKLLDSINLLEIPEEIIDGGRKEYFLVSSLQKNIDKAIDDIEICRKLISVPD